MPGWMKSWASTTLLRGRRRDLLNLVARRGGLGLDLPKAFTKLEDSWLDEPILKRPSPSATTLNVLEDLMGEFDLRSPYGIVLEPTLIRLIPSSELQAFWSDWWQEAERRSK